MLEHLKNFLMYVVVFSGICIVALGWAIASNVILGTMRGCP